MSMNYELFFLFLGREVKMVKKKTTVKRTYTTVKDRKKEHSNYFELYEKYTHYVPVDFGKILDKELEEHFVANFSDISGLRLENATPSIRFGVNSPKTVVLDNYIIDYWGYILEPLPFQVLTTLIRWSYRKGFTNISIVELAERLNKNRETVAKAVDVLESHFFLMKFQRKAVMNGKGESSVTNIFIRLREETPLLSNELFETLPEYMKVEHDRLLKSMNDTKYDGDSYVMTMSKRKHTREFVVDKCTSQNKVDRDISFLIEEHGIHAVAKDVFAIDYEFDKRVKLLLEKLILSKPSYDTFIMNSVFMVDDSGFMSIICKDAYCEEALNSGVFEKLFEGLIKDGKIESVIDYKATKFSTYYMADYNRKHITF